MHNLETLFMAGIGMLIIYGAKSVWWEFKCVLARALYPEPAQIPEPVQEWEYCLSGDHMVRHDAMAWDGHRYICDDCFAGTMSRR